MAVLLRSSWWICLVWVPAVAFVTVRQRKAGFVVVHDGCDESESPTELVLLQQQAQALREEALSMRLELDEQKKEKKQKETAKIDQWIDDLLIAANLDSDTQMIHTVDRVVQELIDSRYSAEQINKIFDRILETSPPQSRSRCSELLATFVDACGQMDCIDDNDNKRWSGKVERVLRKRLFAMDFGMDYEEPSDDRGRWI